MQGERGVAHGGSRGQHLRMIRNGGAVDLRDGLTQLLARGGDVRARRGHRIAGMRELFGGNGAVRDQSAAALQVIVRGSFCLFALIDLRTQFLALREQAAHLAHGAGQIRFGVGLGDLRIRRIELQQRLPGLHELRVIHVQRHHGAGNFAGHLHHVAVDVGVVGGLVIAAVEEPVAPVAEAAEHDDGAQAEQPQAACAAGAGLPVRFGIRMSLKVLACSWVCPRQGFRKKFRCERASASAPEARGSKLPPTGEEQRHPRDGLAGQDVDHGLARGEHLRFGVEHGEIACQSGAIAFLGQLVGGFGGLERLLLIEPLARQRVDARDLIGRLLHGAQHGVVVAGDRRIQLRLAASVLRAQTAAVEQRQRDRAGPRRSRARSTAPDCSCRTRRCRRARAN